MLGKGWTIICLFALSALAIAENTATMTLPQSIGPQQPIGHSLNTPEAKKRIEQLIASTNLKEKSSLGQRHKDEALPRLVGGQYGFAEPAPFQGIPKAFVNLGSASPTYGIIVEKLHHRLSVLKLKDDGNYDIIKTYRAITGKDPKDKEATGDLRTPEGIYFVQSQLFDAELAPKYGKMAFTLDYPNIYDQRLRKSGHGIWIHATDDPKRLLKPFDTEGCVALSNEDILDLEKYIKAFETPVVITKEMTTGSLDEIVVQRKLALDMIEAWRVSWEQSDFDLYDSFYSKNFRSLGKNKKQWQNFKRRLADQRKNSIQIELTEPKILAFEDQLLVVFNQHYKSSQTTDYGKKFLYLQWEGDRYRIIAEKWHKRDSKIAQNM